MAPTIRPMTADDLDATTAAVLDGGWGDRRAWFEFAASHEPCDPLVAVDDGAIVGTGTGTRNGAAGWVGTVFVTPARRRRGLGRALTDAVCQRLAAAGCTTLVLVATDAGRRVYERLGFEVDGWYRVLEAGGTGGAAAPEASAATEASAPTEASAGPRVTGFRPADVDDAAALDRLATGEDRRHLLEAFATGPRGLALRGPAGDVRGFVARAPWGGGATIARTIDDAERLLDARRAAAAPGHPVRAGLLETNDSGLERLQALGWTDVRRIVRMRRGEPLDWRPEMIWGQFNFAMG